MRRRIVALTAAGVAGLVLVSGCMQVPTAGPVEEARSEVEDASDSAAFIDPRPPQQGESRREIVDHFLDAMQATPIQTHTAKEFLTQDAAAAWDPDLQTITYAEPPTPIETGPDVTVTLSSPNHLDERGAWQGALPVGERTIAFPMVIEDGEWRIDAAPDALIVPEDWFETRFRQVSLYFFDPTASILAPEPVYVPKGEQLASSLTQALVKGPAEGLRRVVQSFLPSGLEVAVGVTVSDEGVATIPLQGEAQLSADTTELMMAQLAWTLRQDTAIESIIVSINGEQIPLPGGVSSYRVDGGLEYDPAGFQSSPVIHGLRNQKVVSGTVTALTPVSGPLGTRDYGLTSIGVRLDGSTLAGVAADGTALLAGNLDSSKRQRVRVLVDDAVSLLRPAWDFADRIWLVDRTATGARVRYVQGNTVESLRVPGLSGQQVRSFVVSRDGTRLIAVVRRDGRDTLVVSRIQHAANGRVVGATRAERIGAGGDADRPIRAIAWTSPERVALLVPLSARLASVGRVTVDGSPAGRDATTVPIDARLRSLTGSPDDNEPLYGLARGVLVNVTNQQQVIEIDPGITTLDYVG